MNKNVFVELNGREVEVIEQGLINKECSLHDSIEKGQIVKTTGEKMIESCHSAWAKLDNAKHPQQDVIITAKDLADIKSIAKGEFFNLGSDLHISNKKVEQEDLVHICLANALIMWLNRHNLLKRTAKFDFTDHSSQYEEMDE